MKINPRLLLALLAASSLSATPLSKTTAVYAQPNASSTAIGVLNAGTEPVPATGLTLPVPTGWTAVELAGPHEVYVQNKDILKSLDVKPGANLYTAPKADAPVLTTMSKGDAAEISGLHGRWTQIRLQKKVIGYIAEDIAASPVVAAAAGTPAPAPDGGNAVAPVQTSTGSGQTATLSSAAAAALPRTFEGTVVPVKRTLTTGYRKPYEYQLNDRSGERYAFLDLSHLTKAEPAETYLYRTVTVYGTAWAVENTKEIVIEVDSLQLH